MTVATIAECANMNNSSHSGFAIDIVKCFDQLPRWLTKHIIRHLPMDLRARGIIDAWYRHGDALTKRLRLRGSLGPPWTSSCGYPQGDSMSIFAMTIITEAWRMCVHAQCPRDLGPSGRLMSFADNWEAVAETAHGAFNLLAATISFVAKAGMSASYDKCWTWSTSARGRRFLRHQADTVLAVRCVQRAKDLACGITYTKSRNAQTRNARGKKVQR